MAQLVGNKAIESAAIEWVMALSAGRGGGGRVPRDARCEALRI